MRLARQLFKFNRESVTERATVHKYWSRQRIYDNFYFLGTGTMMLLGGGLISLIVFTGGQNLLFYVSNEGQEMRKEKQAESLRKKQEAAFAYLQAKAAKEADIAAHKEKQDETQQPE